MGVLFEHAGWLLVSDNSTPSVISLGSYSVALFLSLSGFVIGYNYRPYQFNAKAFVYRRFKRIFPTLIACLILTLVIDQIRYNHNFIDNHFAGSTNFLTFITSLCLFDHYIVLQWIGLDNSLITPFEEFGSNRVLWTLSLEWSIYMLYAFLFGLNKDKTFNILIVPYAFIALVSFFYSRIPFMLFCWTLGFLLSSKREISPFLVGITSVVILSLTYFKDFSYFLFTAPIALYIILRIEIRWISHNLGKLLGNISYPLYLCHYPLILLFAPILIKYGNTFTFFSVILISISSSYLIYTAVDKKRNQIISFFMKRSH